jgi:F-type H+-transporting ATPase subunit epsilon
MELLVLTPEKEIFNGSISSVSVPGLGGRFEILKDHAPIVSALGEGNVKIKTASGEVNEFKIKKGFVEVLKNEVSLLVQMP